MVVAPAADLCIQMVVVLVVGGGGEIMAGKKTGNRGAEKKFKRWQGKMSSKKTIALITW